MRKSFVGLLALMFVLSGCTSDQQIKVANTVYTVVEAVVTTAQQDLPALVAAGIFTPAEQPIVNGYLTILGSLNDQYQACLATAQTKLSKVLVCAQGFTTALNSSAVLSELRVLNPKAQSKVQLYIAAVQIALNVALVALGTPAAQPPVLTQSATKAELHEFAVHIGYGRGF
jgi:hypothetical protein